MANRSTITIREEIDALDTTFDLDRFMAAKLNQHEGQHDPDRAANARYHLKSYDNERLSALVDEYLIAWSMEWGAWIAQSRKREKDEVRQLAAQREREKIERAEAFERERPEREARAAREEAEQAERRAEKEAEELAKRAKRYDALRAAEVEAKANLDALTGLVMLDMNEDDEAVYGRAPGDEDWAPLPSSLRLLKLTRATTDQYAAFFGVSRLEAVMDMDGNDDAFAVFDPEKWLRPVTAATANEATPSAKVETVADKLTAVLADGEPRTVAALAAATGATEQAVLMTLKRGDFESNDARPAAWTLADKHS